MASAPTPQDEKHEPTVITTVWQDPDTFDDEQRAEALRQQRHRRESNDRLIRYQRLQRRLLAHTQRLRAAKSPPRTVAPRRAMPTGGRPRAQAARSSSRAADPPSDEPGPQPGLAPPPRAVWSYACLTAEERGETGSRVIA